jgi:hypothetical protein
MCLIPTFMDGRARPKPFIDYAINLFQKRGGSVIVELGGMRGTLIHDIDNFSFPCCEDGHSSILWARTGAEFYSVEKNESAARITAAACIDYPGTKIMHMDALDFLAKLEDGFKIDLLYLDAWDVGLSDCAEMHLESFMAAERLLHNGSMVLIDDTDVDSVGGVIIEKQSEWGGKGRLVIPYALIRRWNVVVTGRQTLLCRQ